MCLTKGVISCTRRRLESRGWSPSEFENKVIIHLCHIGKDWTQYYTFRINIVLIYYRQSQCNSVRNIVFCVVECPFLWKITTAVQTARYCGSGLNMMLLLFIRCLWEYVDPYGMIFSLAFVDCRVGVSGYCGDLSRTTRRRRVLGAMFWMKKDVLLHDR